MLHRSPHCRRYGVDRSPCVCGLSTLAREIDGYCVLSLQMYVSCSAYVKLYRDTFYVYCVTRLVEYERQHVRSTFNHGSVVYGCVERVHVVPWI